MKTLNILTAAGLAIAAIGTSTAAYADRHDNHWHDRDHHDNRWHRGWDHHPVRCHTEWRHHHRVRICR